MVYIHSAPMSEPLKQSVERTWGEEQQEALADIQQAMTMAPMLESADPSLPYVGYTDVTGFGVGTTLLQNQGNGLQLCYESCNVAFYQSF